MSVTARGNHLLQRIGIDVDGGHRGTRQQRLQHDGTAQSATGAGDENHLVRDIKR
jgi:hypothetical protein